MQEGEQQSVYTPEDSSEDFYAATARAAEYSDDSNASSVQWSASEFIEHQKSAGWFMLLGVAAFIIAIAVFLMTRDFFGPIIIALLGVVFGLGAARKPRVLDYSLDETGLSVGSKHYLYEEFRSFSAFSEGPVEGIQLMPTKRWVPGLSVYYSPEDADAITETLGAFVPFEEHKPGLVDKFLSKIRF